MRVCAGMIWGFAGRTYHIVGNLVLRLNYCFECDSRWISVQNKKLTFVLQGCGSRYVLVPPYAFSTQYQYMMHYMTVHRPPYPRFRIHLQLDDTNKKKEVVETIVFALHPANSFWYGGSNNEQHIPIWLKSIYVRLTAQLCLYIHTGWLMSLFFCCFYTY